MNTKSQNNSSGLFSKWLIVLIILMIVIFTSVVLYISTLGMMVSDTLITCWYSFWAVELVNLCVVKVSKVRKPDELLRDTTTFGDNQITTDILSGNIESSSNETEGDL